MLVMQGLLNAKEVGMSEAEDFEGFYIRIGYMLTETQDSIDDFDYSADAHKAFHDTLKREAYNVWTFS